VTFRHGVLSFAALAVLGLGIYLFVAVRATPELAAPQGAPERTVTPSPDHAPSRPEGTANAGRTTRARTSDRSSKLRDVTKPRDTTAAPAESPALPTSDGTELQRLDATMAEANKAYDRGDFDAAKEIALKVLAQEPRNVRMLRIMVSASCIEGDSVVAQKYYLDLPERDRAQMRTRCGRYGVSFEES